MGIYYKTVFYFNIDDLNKFIILAELDPIIDNSDKNRGYVLKNDLIQFVNKKYKDIFFTECVITKNSYIIEYETSTLEVNPSTSISYKIPVK
jgi:hypothetical protein